MTITAPETVGESLDPRDPLLRLSTYLRPTSFGIAAPLTPPPEIRAGSPRAAACPARSASSSRP